MSLTDFSNFAVAAATGLLAIVTFVSNWRMKEQFDAMNRPLVRATVVITGSSAISLQIVNDGYLPAENLCMTLDKDFFINGEKGGSKLNEKSVFARPTKAMPGKTTWNFFLGIGHRLLDPTMGPQEFAVTATYESRGRRFAETLHVDLESFRGTGTVSTTDESEKALKALAKSASEISAQLKLNGQSRTH